MIVMFMNCSPKAFQAVSGTKQPTQETAHTSPTVVVPQAVLNLQQDSMKVMERGLSEADLPTQLHQIEQVVEKVSPSESTIVAAAERTTNYLPLLENKRVAIVANQTSLVKGTHLADTLLSLGVSVKKVFAPEHGFRGEADAGTYVQNGKDVKSGLTVISLYGKNKKPAAADLNDVDVVLFDIQDVGARFYTYISTMHYVMEACAEQGKSLIILDRPNPNGHYVDGPILEPAFSSFVGMHPIPIVHGLTVGELALMINGEGWLPNGSSCSLTIVPCEGYSHSKFYELPIKPSPNLPNSRAIYLYPSLCLFEGTQVSVGRGTDKQFQVIGSPKYNYSFTFTPESKPGATNPPYMKQPCNGFDLSNHPIDELRQMRRIDLSWLIKLYKDYPEKENFFVPFFDKLAGNSLLQQQIKQGLTENQIRQTWQAGLNDFISKRKQYLLYEDVE